MLSFLTDFLVGVFGWLANLLPTSPFTDLINNFAIASDAFHWLNWLVPIGAFANVFVLYLGALAVWMGVNGLLDGTFQRLRSIVGGASA